MMRSGMTKLIHSGVLPDMLDWQISLLEDPARMVKAAASFADRDYVQPDKDHVGIHLIALGEGERYGFNRNGDGFPKAACQRFHPTFVKNGHVYRHHQNKDPKKKLGDIKLSAYNEPMGRIELFIHAHKDRARDELHKLATNGEIPYSMACRVQFDRCDRCNTLRKSASDPNQCDHVRYELGKLANDGTVTGVHNDEPNFFDISFVVRPADRIAWNLKTASDGALDSIKLAEEVGLFTPDQLVLVSGESHRKMDLLKKLAHYEQFYSELSQRPPATRRETELWQLRKAAAYQAIPDEVIDELRNYDPSDALTVLAADRIIMDPVSYVKYAMGTNYGALAEHVSGILKGVNGVYTRLLKTGRAADVCSDSYYDVDASTIGRFTPMPLQTLSASVRSRSSFEEKTASHRAVQATIEGVPVKIATADPEGLKKFDTGVVNCVSERYASYKLAAVSAMSLFNPGDDLDRQLAILAAQNMVERSH
jgi:hypothetical protein